MIVRLEIDDSLYEKYEKMATNGASRGAQTKPEDLMASQLLRFSAVHPMDRPLLVSAKSRQKIESLMGGIFIGDESDLVSRVEQITDIQIQGVRVNFEPGQLLNLKKYATKNGWSLDHATSTVVQQMASNFFDYVPA